MSSKPKFQIETGTQSNKSDVDYDWLPKETLDSLSMIYTLYLPITFSWNNFIFYLSSLFCKKLLACAFQYMNKTTVPLFSQLHNVHI